MGGSSWSDDTYTARTVDRVKSGGPVFAYSAAVDSGVVDKKVHDKLNPRGVIRESRDSAAHPESLAIAILFDVTGSMQTVPPIMQEKLPQMHGLLVRKGYVAHPQVLFGAIGDCTKFDKAPVQVGQFESGLEMDDDITNIWLEGGGGGGIPQESYQLALYFAARKTVTDCFEKRGHKGYLFLIGDETSYPAATRSEVEQVFGDVMQADLTVEELVAEAQQRYHVFFIIPTHTNHGTNPKHRQYWNKLVGSQNVLVLDDESAVCETIATAIGINEGAVDLDGARTHLADAGVAAHVVDATTAAVRDLAANPAAITRAARADLAEGPGGGTVRL